MDNILETSDYGITLFSLSSFQDFLKEEEIRSKKILDVLQKNHNKYLTSLKLGAWIPFLSINSIGYVIKLENNNEKFDESWEKKLEYHKFNLDIKESVWITCKGHFYTFDKDKFVGDILSYQTLDGITLNLGFRYDMESGKYEVSIKGYARKKKLERPDANFGYAFSFVKVNEFEGYRDPREDEHYNFNVARM